MREVTEITINEHGDETHESWLLVRANNVSSGPPGHRLFDSELGHQHFIRVTITRCSRRRDLNHDYKHQTDTLMEFDMSQAQWGAFVSSFGNGSGVPATLSFFGGRVPEAPVESRLALSHKEVREAGVKVVEEVQSDFAALKEAFDGKMGMKEIRARMHTLECRINNTPANMEFAAKSLTKHSENVVTKARSDIEGMVMMAQRQGQELAEGSLPVFEIEAAQES